MKLKKIICLAMAAMVMLTGCVSADEEAELTGEEKELNAVRLWFEKEIYDEDEFTYVLAEMNYDGTERCFYTRGDELISQECEGKKSYYVYDGHGSVRALADDSGKVTDTYNFEAFGNLISSVGSTRV